MLDAESIFLLLEQLSRIIGLPAKCKDQHNSREMMASKKGGIPQRGTITLYPRRTS
jgi:hypothetical protein